VDNIIGLALPLLILIALGFAAGRLVGAGRGGLAWLNILVVYFALPALIFRMVAAAPFDRLANGAFVLGTTLSSYIVFMLMFVVATVVGQYPVRIAAIQSCGAAYGNIGYIGLPLALALFGEEGALPAALIICFDSLLNLTLVPLLQVFANARDGGGAGRGAWPVLANPLILALVLGGLAAYYQVELPTVARQTVDYLADAATPAALFAIGVTIGGQRLEQVGWEVPVIAICKLIAHPVIVLLVLLAIGGFDPVWITVAVLLASLPTAASVFVLANQFEAYVEGISSVILVSTLLSVATVSALLVLIDQDALPMTAAALFR